MGPPSRVYVTLNGGAPPFTMSENQLEEPTHPSPLPEMVALVSAAPTVMVIEVPSDCALQPSASTTEVSIYT